MLCAGLSSRPHLPTPPSPTTTDGHPPDGSEARPAFPGKVYTMVFHSFLSTLSDTVCVLQCSVSGQTDAAVEGTDPDIEVQDNDRAAVVCFTRVQTAALCLPCLSSYTGFQNMGKYILGRYLQFPIDI